jgi:transposase
MISAINNYGTCRFMCYEESMTQQRFIEFLRRLVHDSDRKVFLIVDNLRVHLGKIVKQWLENHVGEIEIFFTSPYSPEINPDEYLNRDIKAHLAEKTIPKSKKALKRAIQRHLTNRQNDKESVIKLFHKDEVLYAS